MTIFLFMILHMVIAARYFWRGEIFLIDLVKKYVLLQQQYNNEKGIEQIYTLYSLQDITELEHIAYYKHIVRNTNGNG